MKRIAIYTHYEGCGKSLIAGLLAYWLEKEKNACTILQRFDVNAGPDVCEVVERDYEGEGYYIMDFLWDDRIPSAFRYLLKKGLVDTVIMPLLIDPIQFGVRIPFTKAFLIDDQTYENEKTKRPQIFCLWNRVPGTLLYDKNQDYLKREKALEENGISVCSSRLTNLPYTDYDRYVQGICNKTFEEVKDRIDDPDNPGWKRSWIMDLLDFEHQTIERQNWLLDKMIENGLAGSL